MTPTAEPGDPSKTAGRGTIAEPSHLSLSILQAPRGRNQLVRGGGTMDGGKKGKKEVTEVRIRWKRKEGVKRGLKMEKMEEDGGQRGGQRMIEDGEWMEK